jgi:hypothetical protein
MVCVCVCVREREREREDEVVTMSDSLPNSCNWLDALSKVLDH